MKETLKNEQIVLPEVRLIGPSSEQLGIMSSEKALEVAATYDLDLVLMAPDAKPPVCKIMDYGKYVFDEMKKLKEQKKTLGDTAAVLAELRALKEVCGN